MRLVCRLLLSSSTTLHFLEKSLPTSFGERRRETGGKPTIEQSGRERPSCLQPGKPGTRPSCPRRHPPLLNNPLPVSFVPAGILRPPLKWPGGKRWLVPHLLSLWRPHAHRRLVEPFCGGLAVSHFYRSLQRGLRLTLRAGHYEKAYLVLGGEGWTLRDYFTSGD